MTYRITAILATLLVFPCCFATAQCTINVGIQQTPDTVCEGTTLTLSGTVSTSGVTFNWTGPGNYSNTGQNITIPIVTLAHAGTYKVVASKSGCPSDSDTVNIVIHAKPAMPSLSSNAPLCIGDTLSLTITSGGGQKGLTPASWGPAGYNDTLFDSKIPAADKTNSGVYSALVTDTFGCVSDTGHLIIAAEEINTRPDTPVITGISPICKGDTLKLSGPSILIGQKYEWEGPGTLLYSTKDIIEANYTLVGKNRFTLTVDSGGCKSVPDTIYVDVLPTAAPKVTISADPGFIVGPHVEVTLTANPVDTGANIQYQWRINGTDVTGETSKTFKVTTLDDVQQGDAITVNITTGPTCNSTATVTSAPVVININLDISETPIERKINIYPNPVCDRLIVTPVINDSNISILSISGQDFELPFTKSGLELSINTSALPAGIYIIRCGDRAARFVKQD